MPSPGGAAIARVLRSLEHVLVLPATGYYGNTMPTITFKVTPREASRIRALAHREGLTVSEFLRRRAVAPPPPIGSGEYRITTDAVTGLPVMAAPAGAPAITSAQIRALLADFP
jgi:hypothetical protein